MAANGLSERQTRILTYIERFVQTNGYPPAIRDIQHDLQISSTSVVAYNLRKLEDKGRLHRDARNARGIKLPEAEPTTANVIPMRRVGVLGAIAAGQPIPTPDSQSEPDEFIEVPNELAPERMQDVYALRVKGNSMIDELIADGDVVLMRYSEQVENGQTAAVRIVDRNEATLKKVYFEGGKVRLQPANPTMKAWTEDADNVQVQGRVVGVLRSMV
jgi:repressor LexA